MKPPLVKIAAVAVFAVFVVSCTPDRQDDISGAEPLTKRERRECLAQGGSPQWFGLAREEGCVFPPEDMGKTCRAKTDCTVQCLAETRTCGALNAGEYEVLDETGRPHMLVVE